jgi:hypothetical protein
MGAAVVGGGRMKANTIGIIAGIIAVALVLLH